MSTPAAWMTTAHDAFVGLNPRYDGGPAVAIWDSPDGNAYYARGVSNGWSVS
jgi:hypothetical protein